jgi:DNA-binding Lrp family transcriptional regulator
MCLSEGQDMKPFIAAQILAYLRANPNGTYDAISTKCRVDPTSVAKAMRKLLDAGMVVGDVRRIENSRATTKDWKITPKGRAADKQNPLGSGSKRYGVSLKVQAMSEMLWRRREADAQAAVMKRKTSGPVVNAGVQPITLPPTKAGELVQDVPAFFAAMPPGVYVLEPASCAARAA